MGLPGSSTHFLLEATRARGLWTATVTPAPMSLIWKATDHSDDENLRWAWLRAIEWINWPLFLSQALMPLLIWAFPLNVVPMIMGLLVVNITWQIAISNRCVSVSLADLGVLVAKAKFLVCPLMAFLLWSHELRWQAAVALLWPFLVLVIHWTDVPLIILQKKLRPDSPTTCDVGPVQRRFMEALGYWSTGK